MCAHCPPSNADSYSAWCQRDLSVRDVVFVSKQVCTNPVTLSSIPRQGSNRRASHVVSLMCVSSRKNNLQALDILELAQNPILNSVLVLSIWITLPQSSFANKDLLLHHHHHQQQQLTIFCRVFYDAAIQMARRLSRHAALRCSSSLAVVQRPTRIHLPAHLVHRAIAMLRILQSLPGSLRLYTFTMGQMHRGRAGRDLRCGVHMVAGKPDGSFFPHANTPLQILIVHSRSGHRVD